MAMMSPNGVPLMGGSGGGPDGSPAMGVSELPPLPDLNQGGDTQGQGGNQDMLASLMSGIGPVKKHADNIVQSAKEIVKLGVIPGSEQIAAQIIALATSLVPMAAQNLLNPMGSQSVGPMLPPPGGPAPLPQ